MTGPGRRRPAAEPAAPELLKILETVLAPATALTALMYFFGLLHAYWFLQTFGVDYSVMRFSTEDYLLRSADGLFVPLTVVAGGALAVLWTAGPLAARIPLRHRRSLRRVGPPVAMAAGGALVLVAVVGVVRPGAWSAIVGLPGAALAVGVLLLVVAVRTLPASPVSTRTPFWEWAAVFLLVNVGLFWGAADYSAAVGGLRGAEVVAALPGWPDAVLYAERDLSLSAVGVVETVCADDDAAYRFRYDGLKLILESGERYLFLPEGWTTGGSALVVPSTDAVRLDFAAAGSARDGTC